MDNLTEPKITSECRLTRILRDDNLRDLIIQYLPVKETLILSHTSREYRKLMMENRFNINAKLKRFNLDPVAFRTALGHSGALISGSFALQFLLGTVWKGTDLDVMVEKGTNMEMLGAFLIEQEGFAVIDSIPDMGRCKYGGECRTYTKASDSYGTATIRLIGCATLPVQAILVKNPTSCVVNFVSWNKAYSIFPRTTFVDRQTVPLDPQSNNHLELLEKYEARGFTVQNVLSRDGRDWDKARHRFVGDKHTWTLNLDSTGITPPNFPDFALESCAFSMQCGTEAGENGNHIVGGLVDGPILNSINCWCEPWRPIRICAQTFTHPSLRYTYTDSDPACFFDATFTETLDRHTRQMFKFDDVKQQAKPNEAGFLSRVHLLRYMRDERPKRWAYLDDMVVQMKDRITQYGHSKCSQVEFLGASI